MRKMEDMSKEGGEEERRNEKKEKLQVLDRTKALHGPRTQAYGETKYRKEKLQVLYRTKALHGPRTQAYGETNCSDGDSPRLKYCKMLRPIKVLG